jgi:DNA topoisomerase VI subunit A
MPLFEAVQLAERYDLAIMTTKGQSVIAARRLIGEIWRDIPLLVLHDFDKAGFSIAATLTRNTYRYRFGHDVPVIDLGLRIGDIDGYVSEPYGPNGSEEATEQNLKARASCFKLESGIPQIGEL